MRSSCPACACQIVTMDRSHNFVTEMNRYWEDAAWEGRGRYDEACECRCHESAKRFLTMKYR